MAQVPPRFSLARSSNQHWKPSEAAHWQHGRSRNATIGQRTKLVARSRAQDVTCCALPRRSRLYAQDTPACPSAWGKGQLWVGGVRTCRGLATDLPRTWPGPGRKWGIKNSFRPFRDRNCIPVHGSIARWEYIIPCERSELSNEPRDAFSSLDCRKEGCEPHFPPGPSRGTGPALSWHCAGTMAPPSQRRTAAENVRYVVFL
eukprot:gene25387-biopygen4499